MDLGLITTVFSFFKWEENTFPNDQGPFALEISRFQIQSALRFCTKLSMCPVFPSSPHCLCLSSLHTPPPGYMATSQVQPAPGELCGLSVVGMFLFDLSRGPATLHVDVLSSGPPACCLSYLRRNKRPGRMPAGWINKPIHLLPNKKINKRKKERERRNEQILIMWH